MSELPEGWVIVSLGDMCEVKGGKRLPKGEKFADGVTDYPYIRVSDLSNRSVNLDKLQYLSSSTQQHISNYTISSKDVYVSIAGTIGVVGTIPEELDGANLTENAAKITEIVCLEQRFLVYFLSSNVAQQHFSDQTVSTSQPKLALFRIKTLQTPLPPLAEQKRIADKLDALLARVDRCRARLDRVPLILKRFRQAVLAAATSGQLTEDWREKNHNNSSSIEQLLELIEQQRNQLWESKTSNRRYSTPVKYDEYSLPEIPDSWHWSSADALCSQVTDGEHIQPPYQSHGYPMLTAKHVRDGFVTFEDVGYVSESDFRKCLERCAPENGDILIVSVGATTGRSAIVENSNPFAIVRSVLLLKPLIPSKYLLRWVQSPWCFKWMTQASGASAQAHLYIKDTKRMPVPVPPLEEQHEIVRRVEILFAYADRLEARYQAARAQVARLTPALLAKAFRGELVAQDPADEPAALLLERLRGTRG